MGIVGVLAWIGTVAQGGAHWPDASAGWWGLAALTACYGTAFTIMFTLLPKLGRSRSSPILNVDGGGAGQGFGSGRQCRRCRWAAP